MTSVQKLRHRITHLERKIDEIQQECSHPAEHLTEAPQTDERRCEPLEQASHWSEFTCGLCQKWWTTQDTSGWAKGPLFPSHLDRAHARRGGVK